MKRTILLFAIFAILLSSCLSSSQPTVGFNQRGESDILRQQIAYIPLVISAETIPLGSAMHPGYFWDERYNDTLAYFPKVTPEVAGGYWWVYGGEGYPAHGWGDMDATYQYALDTGKALHSYPLRWWFPNSGVQPTDIEAWIVESMTRYPLITDWIVVNEGWAYDSCAQTVPLIDESYQIARDVRHSARLWYNGLLFTTCEQEQAISLVQEGLADVVGIQMHNNLDTDYDAYLPLLEWLQDNGVPWQITELDVSIPNTTPEMLQRQAEAYAKVYQLCREYGCEAITMWGVSDKVSWLYAYFPLPFNREYDPKPAWFVLVETEY